MLLLSILWRKWSTEAIWFMVSADLWANIFRDREQQSEIEAEKTSEKSSHIYNIFPVRSKSSMDEVASLFVESLFSHIIFSCTKYPIFLCSFEKFRSKFHGTPTFSHRNRKIQLKLHSLPIKSSKQAVLFWSLLSLKSIWRRHCTDSSSNFSFDINGILLECHIGFSLDADVYVRVPFVYFIKMNCRTSELNYLISYCLGDVNLIIVYFRLVF